MIIKVINILGTSTHNWTDAVDNAVVEASRTINDIIGVEVINFTARVEEGRIVEYESEIKVIYRV